MSDKPFFPEELATFPRIPFEVEVSSDLFLKGDMTANNKKSILLLHGAGSSNRLIFDHLRQFLWKHDISSVSFDFVGHGETGGSLQNSSLEDRFLHSCHVIEKLHLTKPLSIVGNSMSGYTAIKLLERYPVENLVLFVPAVYHENAFHVRFNQGFSDIIRKPRSWIHSDAWKILDSFKGNLLICFAEKDEVIPREIIHRLYDAARNAKKRALCLIQNGHHKKLYQNPETREKVLNEILNLLSPSQIRPHSFL